MTTSQISPVNQEAGAWPRKRSGLDTVILIGLFTVVAVDAASMAIKGTIIPPVVVFMTIYLLCGVIVATGWRWAAFFPLVLCTLGLVGELTNGFPVYSLTHPGADHLAFASFAINYPLLIMVIGASAIKLAQVIRRETPHLPRWSPLALGCVAGVIAGALVIGLITQAPAAGDANASTAGTATVHLKAATFAPDIVALHTGDTLTLIDDMPIPHTLTNGVWSADNQPVPGTEPGAPVVSDVAVNNTTVTIGPFTSPGTYHIYCTVHPGMALTILVQ
jgi:plastocyanin